MGGGATETNVPQNPYTQQSAGTAWNAVQDFSQLPNYAQGVNDQYTSPLYNPLLSPTSFNPQSLVDTGNNMTGQAQNLYADADATMGIGLDPNKEQYDYYSQILQDKMNAENAMSGVATTPYGAGVTDNGLAGFTNQWAMSESQKANAALGAATSAYGQAANQQGAGQELAMSAPAFQEASLSQLIQTLMSNYTQPQQNVTNQLGYMGAANAQNATAVSSAQQQNAAAQANSPWGFLGKVVGTA